MKIWDIVQLHPSVSHPMYSYKILSLKSRIEGYVTAEKSHGLWETFISLKAIV